MTAEWGNRLARTPYLVIPRLALQAMPQDWQDRMEQLLQEADDAGMETPTYNVFRDLNYCDDPFAFGVKNVSDKPGNAHYVFGGRKGIGDDPWSNYRYGNVDELCPTFAQRKIDARSLAERTEDAYSADLFAAFIDDPRNNCTEEQVNSLIC